MSRPVSRVAIISSIVAKDFREFSRDTLYIFLSILGLVFYIAMFYVMPDTVDESITLGVHQTGMDALIDEFQSGTEEAEGLDLIAFESAEELRRAVAGELDVYRTDAGGFVLVGEGAEPKKPKGATKVAVTLGLAFPERFLEQTATGEKTTVTLYTDAEVPPEIQGAMRSFVREIAYQIAGEALPVTEPAHGEIVLGDDRMGDQASMRDKLRPMLAFFVLMIETFALSSLIASEVTNRTVTAVLVTPAKVGDFLAAKTIFGTLLAGSQALLLLIVLQALTADNWTIMLGMVLLGSLMFTGIAMVTGSAGKDFIGTLFYNMLFLLPLMIPAFSVLFPGTAAAWVRFMPSYPILRTFYEVATFNAGWADVAGYVALAAVWVVAIYLAGLFVLKRKVETL